MVPLPFCKVTLKAPKPKPPSYPSVLNTLGDHIRKKRLDLRLLQRQVAQQIGVSEATIYNWEGNRTKALRKIPAVLRFLGYSPWPNPASFPERLVLYRRVLGLSRRQMAKTLGVNESTLARWETGRGSPAKESLKILEDLLQALGTSSQRTIG